MTQLGKSEEGNLATRGEKRILGNRKGQAKVSVERGPEQWWWGDWDRAPGLKMRDGAGEAGEHWPGGRCDLVKFLVSSVKSFGEMARIHHLELVQAGNDGPLDQWGGDGDGERQTGSREI